MKPSLIENLRALYGDPAAEALIRRVGNLKDHYQKLHTQGSNKQPGLSLSESDALLITYGDQVRQNGEAPLRTLENFCRQHLCETLNGVHLLPHFPFTSDDGFSVTDYFAVNPELGTWEDVERLAGTFDLMLDAVFNHMSAGGGWFQKFLADDPDLRDFFVSVEGNPDLSKVVRPRALPLLTEFESVTGLRKIWTTFSADQVDLNAKNPEVLLALLNALLFYVSKGARYIRLDAIAYLWKTIGTNCIHLPETHRVIQVFRAVLLDVAPHVMLVTETNVPHADNISYFGDGQNEAQLVYNFPLPPMVLHALLRGDGRHLTRWAHDLKAPSDQTTFFNFLASHDGIGLNPARGLLPDSEIAYMVDRCQAHGGRISYKNNANGTCSPYEMNIVFFDALNDCAAGEELELQVDRFLVSQAIMLVLRGVPGIYFHSLFGSRNDFEAAASSGIHRRINRRKLEKAELERELADPGSLRSRVFGPFCKMLKVRRNHAAFSPGVRQSVLDLDSRVFALVRSSPDGDGRILCVNNVTCGSVSLSIDSDGVMDSGGTWKNLVGKESLHFAGKGSLSLTLRPYEFCWLKAEPEESMQINEQTAHGSVAG